ncbi:MAG: Mur ligase family protein [Acidobacteria bacterium]|nr:Mur ligase family protein [Acidobacteriota bacterium]
MLGTRYYLSYPLSAVSLVWRRLMFRTRFIAVAGSMGKTTATKCLEAMLAPHFPVCATENADNGRVGLAGTILRTRFRHRYTVVEVGTRWRGAMRKACWQVDPDIVVMLCVAGTHSHHFPTLEHTAAEKAWLLSRLRPDGLAVLNGEDPRVMAMAARRRSKVLTFGRSPQCDFRASDITAVWPARLSFRVHHGGESCPVQTRLVGEQWVNSILAAFAVAVACGVSLKDAAAALPQVEPYTARLQPLTLPSGAIMLRDEYQGSMAGSPAAFRALREARDCRRVLVHGDIWDTGLDTPERAAMLGRQAAESADFAVFAGEHARAYAGAAVRSGMKTEDVRSFAKLDAAADFLKTELRAGDVALLRGKTEEHLSRLYFAQIGPVVCWKPMCDRLHLCDSCNLLSLTKSPPSSGQ